MTKNYPEIWDHVSAKQESCFALSDTVWDHPELNFTEHHACDAHEALLRSEGFVVERGVAGLPTALMAEAGKDGSVIAFLGEYDALPGLGQVAGLAQQQEPENGNNGHGCGHNLLGSGSMLAAIAVKDWLHKNQIKGRVRYYGCPAEEGGSGKGFMVRAGLFDDVDIAICWHPGCFAGLSNPVSLACYEMIFSFKGRASHAAAAPHLGRSALDAVELMNVGVNYMREHMPSTARIHYAVTDTGGIAPNVVQAQAAVRYLIRDRQLPDCQNLVERVINIAKGAALMTETQVSHKTVSADANLIGNQPLENIMQKVLEQLGSPDFDDQDREKAKSFQQTLSRQDIENSFKQFGIAYQQGLVLCDEIYKPYQGDTNLVGSTDVGTVSWVVPTVQMRGATSAIGTPLHSWQMTAQGKLPYAHKGMAHAAKAMACVAVEVFTHPERLPEIKNDLIRQRGDEPFVNPLAPEVEPDLPVA